MSEQSPKAHANHTSESLHDSDEINLADIFNRLSATVSRRYLTIRLVLLILISTILIGTIVWLIIKPPLWSYGTVVTFTFPQAQNGQYPNGSQFRITELISNKVLRKVWTENQLETLGLGYEQFAAAISVAPYSDSEDFIRAKYQARLQARNITQTEITSLESAFLQELQASISRQAKLMITAPYHSPLSGDLATKLLMEIPKAWSELAVDDLGVTSIPMAQTEILNIDLLTKSSPFTAIDYFHRSSRNILAAIAVIESFPGGESLRDPASGSSLQDFRRRLQDYVYYLITELDQLFQETASPSDREIRTAQLRLRELQVRRDTLLARVETYRKALAEYDSLRIQTGGVSGVQGLGSDQVGVDLQSRSGGIQLQGDSIDRLIDLGSQNRDAQFRQSLINERVEAEIQALNMSEEMVRLERRIAAGQDMSVNRSADVAEFQEAVAQVASLLADISNGVSRISETQTARFQGDTGRLYTESTVQSTPAVSLARYFGPSIALALTLLVFLWIATFLRNYARKRGL
ncbi:MAG: hypothetical protein LRY56_06415 [Burkholderiaceae bacterium]|nr:hypothetical protein [Burkholderiaceae bacterium]